MKNHLIDKFYFLNIYFTYSITSNFEMFPFFKPTAEESLPIIAVFFYFADSSESDANNITMWRLLPIR